MAPASPTQQTRNSDGPIAPHHPHRTDNTPKRNRHVHHLRRKTLKKPNQQHWSRGPETHTLPSTPQVDGAVVAEPSYFAAICVVIVSSSLSWWDGTVDGGHWGAKGCRWGACRWGWKGRRLVIHAADPPG